MSRQEKITVPQHRVEVRHDQNEETLVSQQSAEVSRQEKITVPHHRVEVRQDQNEVTLVPQHKEG